MDSLNKNHILQLILEYIGENTETFIIQNDLNGNQFSAICISDFEADKWLYWYTSFESPENISGKDIFENLSNTEVKYCIVYNDIKNEYTNQVITKDIIFPLQ